MKHIPLTRKLPKYSTFWLGNVKNNHIRSTAVGIWTWLYKYGCGWLSRQLLLQSELSENDFRDSIYWLLEEDCTRKLVLSPTKHVLCKRDLSKSKSVLGKSKAGRAVRCDYLPGQIAKRWQNSSHFIGKCVSTKTSMESCFENYCWRKPRKHNKSWQRFAKNCPTCLYTFA
jgi:hypothetical protein